MDKPRLNLASFAQPGIFLAANRLPYQKCRAALVGLPMDYTVSYRGGARWGPDAIRQASAGLETFSLRLGRELEELAFYDCGNLLLPPGNTAASLARIQEAAGQLAADGKLPVFLGGEHLVSAATVQTLAGLYPDLVVIQLDAHADLREDYLGERLSHATALRLVAGAVGPRNVYQFGIRSATAAELAYSEQAGTHLYPLGRAAAGRWKRADGATTGGAAGGSGLLADLEDVLTSGAWEGRPVYLTIDIDVVDPAYAPGTGTPEPGGCSAAELLEALYLLKPLRVMGLDVVEVAPEADLSRRTAMLAAKLLREALLLWG